MYLLGCVCVCTCVISVVSDSVTPQTLTHQAPLSMGFFRQEYWSGLPFSSLGELPNPGIEPTLLQLLHWQVGSLLLSQLGSLYTYVYPLCFGEIVLAVECEVD